MIKIIRFGALRTERKIEILIRNKMYKNQGKICVRKTAWVNFWVKIIGNEMDLKIVKDRISEAFGSLADPPSCVAQNGVY